MSPSELIHVFIDSGPLESRSESTLFDALATNGDLRTELRDLLAIRAAVQSDVAAYTPPAEVTDQLFAILGIGPATPAAGAAQAGMGTTWLRKAWLPLVAALLASGITAVVMSQLHSAPSPVGSVGSAGSVGSIVTQTAPSAQSAASSSAMSPAVVPQAHRASSGTSTHTASLGVDVRSQRDQSRDNTTTQLPPAQGAMQDEHHTTAAVIKGPSVVASTLVRLAPASSTPVASTQGASDPVASSPVTSPVQSVRDEPLQTSISTSSAMIAVVPHTQTPIASFADSTNSPAAHPAATNAPVGRSVYSVVPAKPSSAALVETFAPPPTLEAPRMAALKTNTVGDYGIQLRGIAAQSSPSTSVASANTAIPTNVVLGVFHMLGSNMLVGVELAQEAFGQTFTGVERDSAVQYSQNPILPWGAAMFRAITDPLQFLGGIAPYAQVNVGATSVGPLGRVSLGLTYDIADRYELLLGAEGSRLWYTYQSSWFMTTKVGVTFGAAFRF